MALLYGTARPILQGQNIRPPLGTFFNGRSYHLKLFPELGRSDRSVLVVRMVLQFQFDDSGDGGAWSQAEKNNFAHGFVNAVVGAWSEKFRITTTSTVPVECARNVGVVFEFPYYIDGWHSDDDFELSVKKIPAGIFNTSTCGYSIGNTYLDSEDLTSVSKGASTGQRAAVHEFGHMLGLRDEYAAADDNPHHTGDVDSIMNAGETVRPRHYAPFAGWLTAQFATAAHLTRSTIDYKVDGTINMGNALL